MSFATTTRTQRHGMLPGRIIVLSAVAIALCLSPSEAHATQDRFALKRVRSYGLPDVHRDSTYGLSRMELNAGGPALAEPVAVAVAADGTVYILDRKFFKIAVFDENGRIRRVILGGSGSGPGEFRQPTWMAMGPAGSLFVLDFNLARVTEFAATGQLMRVIAIRNVAAAGIAVSGPDSLWLVDWSPNPAEHAVALMDFGGRLRSRGFTTTPRDRAFADFGAMPVLGLVRGRLHAATGQPGQWWVEGSPRRLGQEFFPTQKPQLIPRPSGPMKVVPAMARAIVGLSGGRIGLVYSEFRPLEPVEEMRTYNWLAIYTAAGELQGRLQIPGSAKLSAVAASPDGRYLYVNESDPYPRLLQYELTESGGRSR